jgi:hypothetical protein
MPMASPLRMNSTIVAVSFTSQAMVRVTPTAANERSTARVANLNLDFGVLGTECGQYPGTDRYLSLNA